MIDSVKLYLEIEISKSDLSGLKWRKLQAESGRTVYVHVHKGVRIKYFPLSRRLCITGKILRLVDDSQIKNVDDVYGMDLDRFSDDINAYLNRLLRRTPLDIRDFTVSRIDYCFNVRTPYVDAYIDFLGRAFEAVDKGSRRNFAAEHGENGSVYIKTRSDYENNRKTAYALNFYNKEDWLKKKRQQGAHFSADDLLFVRDILRLEVQTYSRLVDRLAEELGMDRSFGSFLRYDVALYAMAKVYKNVFGGDAACDFYKYAFAKRVRLPEKARKLLELSAEHHRINSPENRHYLSKIKAVGIYPYCFLPKKSEPDVLSNPLGLILSKIEEMENRG